MERGAVYSVAGLLIATGLIVMAGWIFRLPGTVMVFNTALSFLVLGVGLLAAWQDRRQLQGACGAFLIFLPGTVLVQYITGLDFGLNQMVVTSAVLFIASGFVLLLGVLRSFGRWRSLVGWVLGVMVAAFGLATSVAYLLGLTSITGPAGITLMAPVTSLAFALAGLGLMMQAARWSPQVVGNRERWAGAIAAVTIIVAGFNLWYGLTGYQLDQLRGLTEQSADGMAGQLQRGRTEHSLAFERMGRRIGSADGRFTLDDWRRDAVTYLQGFPGVRLIAYINEDGLLVDAVSADGPVGLPDDRRFAVDRTRAELLERARATMQFTASGPVTFRRGGRGALLLVPFPAPDGVHALLFGVEYQRLFSYLLDGLSPGYFAAVSVGDELVYETHPGQRAGPDVPVARRVIPAVGPDWVVEVWPDARVDAAASGPLPMAVLVLALAAAGLVALAMYLAALSRAHLREALAVGDELREQQEINEFIWSDAQDLFMVIDLSGRIIRAGGGCKSILGYEPDELTGTQCFDLIEPADLVKARLELEKVLEVGSVDGVTERWRHRDGYLVQIEWSGVHSKELGLIIGVARNLTERIKREERIRASEERLRIALQQADRVVYERDLVTGKSDWIGPTHKLLGYEPAEMAAMSRTERRSHVHTDDLGQAKLVDATVARGGGSFTMEYRWIRPDDSSVWLEDTGAVEGNRMIAVLSDVTARHETEARLERHVQERTAELEAFSYSVSHDLRTPLRAIAGFAELLDEQYADKLDDDGRHYLRRVIDGSTRMSQLIDDLLLLSRVTRQQVHRTEVDLTRVAERVVEQLREADPGRQVEVRIESGLVASADPRQVEVVLTNLLGNAWKFTGGSDDATIRLEACQEGFRVVDNGAGFDMQYSSNMFGVFQRLHAVDEFPGTGVGLAIVKRIVERHGGRIHAEGVVGNGASFYFDFGG